MSSSSAWRKTRGAELQAHTVKQLQAMLRALGGKPGALRKDALVAELQATENKVRRTAAPTQRPDARHRVGGRAPSAERKRPRSRSAGPAVAAPRSRSTSRGKLQAQTRAELRAMLRSVGGTPGSLRKAELVEMLLTQPARTPRAPRLAAVEAEAEAEAPDDEKGAPVVQVRMLMKRTLHEDAAGEYVDGPTEHFKPRALPAYAREIVRGSLGYLGGGGAVSIEHRPGSAQIDVVAPAPEPDEEFHDANAYFTANYGELAGDTWKGGDTSINAAGTGPGPYDLDFAYVGVRERLPNGRWGLWHFAKDE